MSSSGLLSGRVGALGAAAAARLSQAARARVPNAFGGADAEELMLATPAGAPADPAGQPGQRRSGRSPSRRAPSMAQTAALVERLTMEADLRHALTAGDLVLRYQPIVDLAGGRILAFETLCRWRHWSRGLLGPAHFMPLAEETGLIVPLGAWVLEESTRRLAQWRGRVADHGEPHLPRSGQGVGGLDVTVNLSDVELRDRGLVDRTAHALDVAGLPAARLVVEVNEAAAYAEPQDRAVRNLRALIELGVGLAVDDVGAPRPGHRSGQPDLDGWLWDLPVRLVKIDRGVVARLEDGGPTERTRATAADGSPGRAADGSPGTPGEARRLLAGAVGLAADRGALAVAKGVETPDQLAQLYRLGCPAGQGFLFARPMDPADAEAYLRRLTRSRRSA